MHPLFHSFKRAYWSSMREARPIAEEYETTPARLDMLFAIAHDPAGIAQNALRRVLDVTSPVISRLLRVLEYKGLVFRREYPRDRRTRWVSLTAEGEVFVDILRRELLHDGLVERGIRGMFCRRPDNHVLADREMTRMRRTLGRARRCLFDRSSLLYPTYLPNGDRSPHCPFDPGTFMPPGVFPVQTWTLVP